MKRIAAILLSVVMVVAGAVTASAASTLADGTYTVSVKMMHASKDQESMSNKFIGHTALLKVSGGSYKIYVVPADDYTDKVDSMSMEYYTNGSVEGDKASTTVESNVKINGTTYPKAFAFTLPNQSGTYGLYFKAPIMPMAQSAKLVVDFGSAKLIEAPTTQPQAQAEPQAQESKAPEETNAPATESAESAAEESSSEELTSEPATEESTTGDELADENGSSATVWIVVGVVAAVVVIGGAAAYVIVKKKKA